MRPGTRARARFRPILTRAGISTLEIFAELRSECPALVFTAPTLPRAYYNGVSGGAGRAETGVTPRGLITGGGARLDNRRKEGGGIA